MKKTYLPVFQKEASVIALGTDGFGVNRTREVAEELLDCYVAAGGNVIDSARMYGRPEVGEYGICEGVTGEWMAKRGNRDRLILSTKGGYPDVHGRPRLDRQSLLSDVQASREALQAGFIDIYFLHRDDPQRPVGDIVETLNEMIDRGWVGSVGASNWTAQRIREANAYAQAHGLRGFAGTQPQWSLARQVVNPDPTLVIMQDDLFHLHRETDMLCMPFSAQAKGYFAKLLSGGEQALSPKAKARFHFSENIAVAERLQALCEESGCAPAAMSLAWLISQPFATIPIISARDSGQLLESLAAGDITLDAAQRDALRSML